MLDALFPQHPHLIDLVCKYSTPPQAPSKTLHGKMCTLASSWWSAMASVFLQTCCACMQPFQSACALSKPPTWYVLQGVWPQELMVHDSA